MFNFSERRTHPGNGRRGRPVKLSPRRGLRSQTPRPNLDLAKSPESEDIGGEVDMVSVRIEGGGADKKGLI